VTEFKKEKKEEKEIRWNWVGITLAMYLLLYVAPIAAGVWFSLPEEPDGIVAIFLGVWLFGGMVLVSGLAGYLSEGVTIVEPALAAAILFIIGMLVERASLKSQPRSLTDILANIGILSVIFVLAVLGAWYGEKIQA
jgi:hypothetical protein